MRANWLQDFLEDEQGQDLIEYSLLLGCIVCASVALFQGVSTSVAGVWDEGSELLVNGVNKASQ
jgi:Flp pilus assembly pilin Flp